MSARSDYIYAGNGALPLPEHVAIKAPVEARPYVWPPTIRQRLGAFAGERLRRASQTGFGRLVMSVANWLRPIESAAPATQDTTPTRNNLPKWADLTRPQAELRLSADDLRALDQITREASARARGADTGASDTHHWSEADTAAFRIYAASSPATAQPAREPLFGDADMARIERAFAATSQGPRGSLFE